MGDGFYIEGLADFQKILASNQQKIPETMKRILESLGEVLIDKAQDVITDTNTPHSRFAMKSKPITRGKNKGKSRNYLSYIGKVAAGSSDTGRLADSFSKGGSGNIWTMNRMSGSFVLVVGSNVKHGKFINDGFNRKRRWVPGVVDGNGIFRYQPGAKTGVMVSSGRFMGLHFFEIALDEVKKVMPEVIEFEMRRFFDEFG